MHLRIEYEHEDGGVAHMTLSIPGEKILNISTPEATSLADASVIEILTELQRRFDREKGATR